jgi:hypothetical protein
MQSPAARVFGITLLGNADQSGTIRGVSQGGDVSVSARTVFLAMLFASAAVAGGVIIAYAARPEGLLGSATFTFARAVT